MSISERIEGTVENWRVKWGEALREWAAGFVSWGIEQIMDITGQGLGTRLDEILDQLAIEENIPPDIVAKAKDLWKPGGEWQALLGSAAGGTAVGSIIGSTIGPYLMLLQYTIQRQAKQFRLDTGSIIAAWLRDKPGNEALWEDLKDQGWDEDRIAVAKELAKIIPPLADMVRFADFSAFDPEVIAKWRQFYDAPGWVTDPMSLIGITNEEPRDWANKYWFSHWIQPGRYELGEIYRRGLLGTPLVGSEEVGGPGGEGEAEEAVKLAYRTMGYSAYWQDLLLQLVRSIPTRVDVRRWWDMATIDEAELRSLYQRQGYFGKDLENYVLWTKVYVAFPDLLSRWSNGWITEADVRAELAALGMPAARIETLMQTKIKAIEGGKVDAEKALTKAEIYRGVKTGKITREEAVDLLIDLNYTETQAGYLLDTNIPPDEEEAAVQERALTKADILNGLKAEIITEQEAHEKLLGLRYTADNASFLLKIFNALVKPPTEPRDKEASKADIVKAVKTGLITPEDGYLMLQDIGFTPEASQFILMVQAESSPFSPVNFAEFKDLTTKYKIAIGKEEKPMPEEIKTAAAEVVRLTSEVEALQRSLKEEERGLISTENLPEAATAERDELRVALHRAEAELFSAKIAYDGLVAKWRQGV